MFQGLLVSLLLSVLALSSQASSRALLGSAGAGDIRPPGCPWCTTPTTCALVDEDTPYDWCYVNQEEGCVAFTLGGPCEFEPHEEEEELVLANGLRAITPQRVVYSGVERSFWSVGDNLLVSWTCSGTVAAVLELHRDSHVVADPATYAAYGLDLD